MKNEMRLRPKGDYLHTATWDELYVLTEHWKSDQDFFRDEIRFLYKLIDKFFVWLTHDENISNIQSVAARLSELNQEHERINEKLGDHLFNLESLIENEYGGSKEEFREEHVQLEESISEFVKNFREIKKEIFKVSEQIIES